jgi:hypothetical protein
VRSCRGVGPLGRLLNESASKTYQRSAMKVDRGSDLESSASVSEIRCSGESAYRSLRR